MKLAHHMLSVLVLLGLITGCAGAGATATPEYWPTTGWRTSTPEQQGLDSATLAQMFEAIEAQGLNLRSLLIIRNGYLVTEAYFNPYRQDNLHMLASVTKSVIGMLVGRAIDEGAISGVKQPLLSFFPERQIANTDVDKLSITLENLLALNSGLDCQDSAGAEAALVQSPDWVKFMLDLPMAHKPGEQFSYCSGAVHLLSAILQQATGTNPRLYANQNLFGPLGIAPVADNAWLSDPQGLPVGGWGLYLRPRDMAKLGYLYLKQGRWDGKQIIPAAWVAASSRKHSTWTEEGREYGYLFWLYPEQGYYSAMGMGGQQIHIVPEKNMVVVFTSAMADDKPLAALLNDYILAAVKSDGPLAVNAGAAEQLAQRLETAAEPMRPVPQLPVTALRISGKAILLAPNETGLESVVFTFREGAVTAQVAINGEPPVELGLDHLYRPAGEPGIGSGFLRGHWEDEATFVVEQLQLGNLDEIEYRVTVSGNDVHLLTRNRFPDRPSYEMLGTLSN